MKKKLIIVADDKRQKFANHLAQLISSCDDIEDTVIGIKDGTLDCQVWTEKDYRDDSKTIASNQFVLFIGNSALIKEKRSFVPPAFNEYGIFYGWLGTQAFLSVTEVVPFDKYNDFIEFAKQYEESIKKVVKCDERKKNIITGAAVGGSAIGFLFAHSIFVPLFSVGMVIPFYKRATMKREIKEQMYKCALIKFYLEGINKFLGLE